MSGNDELGELLSAYLDGELSEQETAFVEGTVLKNAEAGHLLDELRRTAELVGSLPRHQAPVSICEDLKSHLERQELLASDDLSLEVVDHEPRSWFAWLSMAAMIALVAISGVWMLSNVSTRNTGEQGRLALLGPKDSASDEEAIGDAKSIGTSNTKKRDTRKRSAGARRSQPERLERASGPTAEQKLAMGEPVESLRLHKFDAEPLRLRMVVSASDRLEAVAQKLVRGLASHRAVNLQTSFKGKRRDRDRAQSKGFFYEGNKGKNFAASNSRQILVRVPVSALDTLLEELGRDQQGTERIELHSGSLLFRGVPNIRSTLSLIDSESDKSATTSIDSKRTPSREETVRLSEGSTKAPAPTSGETSFLRKLASALEDDKGHAEQFAQVDKEGGRTKSKSAKTEPIFGPPEASSEAASTMAAAPAAAATDMRFVTLVVELSAGESAPIRTTAAQKKPSTPTAKTKTSRTQEKGADKPVQ